MRAVCNIEAQRDLARELSEMLAARGYEIDVPERLSNTGDAATLFRQLGEEVAPAPETWSVAVALAAFDLADYLQGLWRFLQDCDETALRAWFQSFTKTVYLAGLPRRFGARSRAEMVVSPSGTIGFLGPDTHSAHSGITQLLQPLRTARAPEPVDVMVAVGSSREGGRRRVVDVNAPALRSLESYLIALGHTLAEGWCLGHIRPGDQLEIRHVESIDALPLHRLWVRIEPDARDPEKLGIMTVLQSG